MDISIFDLFNIGLGPSSSHSIGPMRAAKHFALLQPDNLKSITCTLYGSIAYTGAGHGTFDAIVLGLSGYLPEQLTPLQAQKIISEVKEQKKINLNLKKSIEFDISKHIICYKQSSIFEQDNAMLFAANTIAGKQLERAYFSIGGGFVLDANKNKITLEKTTNAQATYQFNSADTLLKLCQQHNLSIAEVVQQNELNWRSSKVIDTKLHKIWQVMDNSIAAGIKADGVLPGVLHLKRRAKLLAAKVKQNFMWLNIYAIAVNEENAACNTVVTAPTNGAAGVIPAILKYYTQFEEQLTLNCLKTFFYTAGAIGLLFKQNAGISGASMGCQGEVGVAAAMAAAGWVALKGGTPAQVEHAAEIAIEHHLGLTCDPVAGLVQIPCIERNAMGAIKAYNAAQLALAANGEHTVSLDMATKSMQEIGQEMHYKFKETSLGGLAVNVIDC